jgi:hypothetical protein
VNDALQLLVSAKAYPVISSGNDYSISGIAWPACSFFAISVGAVDNYAKRATFSNIAPILTIMAPGVGVAAGGVTLSGASQAAPHVTGGIASIISQFPSDGWTTLVNRLKSSGQTTDWPVKALQLGNLRAMYGDATANAFSFSPRSGVATNSWIESDSVTPSGFNMPVSITVAGGSYSILGQPYTTTQGQILPGQSVKVKVLSSVSSNTTTYVDLTVGGALARFNVTTNGPSDQTPDQFYFTPVYSAPTNTWIESSWVTPSGFNVAAPVTIEGGLYTIGLFGRIPLQPYTSAAGQILAGQVIRVKTLSSQDPNVNTAATLNIGGTIARFDVFTNNVPTAVEQIPIPPAPNVANTLPAILFLLLDD